ncbi:MAG: 4-alpha-glucanotransferase [Lachnospirales bacterium]
MVDRKSGILVHPTSFPSKYGIGDLNGAYDFIDFLEKANQKLWQVLPLGPTSFGDSPYQSFSTFAGNDLLISPDELIRMGHITEGDIEPRDFDPVSVEYGNVIKYKNNILKKAFVAFKEGTKSKEKKKFNHFVNSNPWIIDYSMFRAIKDYYIKKRENEFESVELRDYRSENPLLTEDQIKDYYYGAMWNTWDESIKNREPDAMEFWKEKLENEIEYYKYTQYEFFRQWQEVKEYANSKDIKIIGDIPIFVSMDSADVWVYPSLFHLDKKGSPTKVAGVPPDYFSETGQLWGNPLYNWTIHSKTKYKWWVKRISATLKMVDIVRIDHFRAFQDYWAVDFGEKTAIKGKWEKGPEKGLFNAIKRELGNLPIIAEDLGIITDDVRKLREELGLPGMKILQFAFDTETENAYLPHNFEDVHSVCYTGTHDNNTTFGWHKELTPEVKDVLHRYLNVSGDDIAWDLIRLCFSTVSEYAIVPVQDVLSLNGSARMNTPGVAVGNWQFRYIDGALNDGMAEGLRYLSKMFDRNLENLEDDIKDEVENKEGNND